MAIYVHESSKTFHLTNGQISYILRIMANGQPENLYYGAAVRDREDFSFLHDPTAKVTVPYCTPEPETLSLYYTRQDYPTYGSGDYRTPALTIRQKSTGSRNLELKSVSFQTAEGKEPIDPLPSCYVEEEEEAETLEMVLADGKSGAEVTLFYTIFRDYPVIARHVRIDNRGSDVLNLERVMSLCVDLADTRFQTLTLTGGWARERAVTVADLKPGVRGIQGLDGTCGGAEYNPFLALKRPETTEQSGEVYGFCLLYSGNFLAQAEETPFGLTRVLLGIHPENFSWKLEPGESFTAPEALAAYSGEGLGGMSRAFHAVFARRLCRGQWRDKERPVLVNSWEACYFDFDEEKLLSLARTARDAGVELFVLDDGWFGKRQDSTSSLGDWYPNLEKIPSGISGLSRKIGRMGLKFGLWIEPEMISKDSDLYRAHPDWVLGESGRFHGHARHQYVLDFSRPEVVDHIHSLLYKVLSGADISYVKWDMNRYMTEPYSQALPPDRQGEVMHRYILGVYTLYGRLTEEFPQILFESCASGGARFDPGMLYYAPQGWCSDNTDAADRVRIQYGTSMLYPLSSIGSHVTISPNEQTGRRSPADTRAAVACFGTFGYEMDLGRLSREQLVSVKAQTAFMKKWRRLIQIDGRLYRLAAPYAGILGQNPGGGCGSGVGDTGYHSGDCAAWMVVSEDRDRALVFYYQERFQVNGPVRRLRLAGLCPDREYRVNWQVRDAQTGQTDATLTESSQALPGWSARSRLAFGDELMNVGIPIFEDDVKARGGDYACILFELTAGGDS